MKRQQIINHQQDKALAQHVALVIIYQAIEHPVTHVQWDTNAQATAQKLLAIMQQEQQAINIKIKKVNRFAKPALVKLEETELHAEAVAMEHIY